MTSKERKDISYWTEFKCMVLSASLTPSAHPEQYFCTGKRLLSPIFNSFFDFGPHLELIHLLSVRQLLIQMLLFKITVWESSPLLPFQLLNNLSFSY